MFLSQYFNTIRYLKPIQIRYQIYYRFRKKWRKLFKFNYPLSLSKEGHPLNLSPWIEKPVSFLDNLFTFLNQTKTYPDGEINWDEDKFGLLWAYNLNYMDYLLQPEMSKKKGETLIKKFIDQLPLNKTGLDPYPISLRGINWIKFLSNTHIRAKEIDHSLYAQYKILADNLEYHLLGNHLLENGFSLLYGAFYFKDPELYTKAKQIIESELKEQVLDDGGHFELSPMYHQIILDHLLDCINLVQNNKRFENQDALLSFMEEKALKMFAWLKAMTFSNGEIPLLNDSAPGIAPTTRQLNEYAASLNLKADIIPCAKLSVSGYRRFNGSNYECIIDIGQIGPSYQPGHAHADTFNFVLNIHNEPFLIDTGISTYNTGQTRLKERGTAAHNTVTIQDNNSSEVWSSFRVASRAKVNIIKDESNSVIAEHNGYRHYSTIHQRAWDFDENQILISDTLKSKIRKGEAHYWLSPQLKPKQNNHTIRMGDATMMFENSTSVKIIPVKIPNGYNQFLKSYKIEIVFNGFLRTIIKTA